MHQSRRVRVRPALSAKRLIYALVVAVSLAAPGIAYASEGNSNPLCYLVEKYSIEWYVLFCNWTEDGDSAGG